MKSRCVLVVNERQTETAVIRKILMGEYARTTVFTVQSGRQALDVLMGGQSDILSEGVLPDAVIVSDSLPDMKPLDLSNIVRKYYRLRNIPFYLLSEVSQQTESHLISPNFSGYFQRPIADDTSTRQKFLQLNAALDDNAASLIAVPLFGFFAHKFSTATGVGFSAASKVAACVAVIGSACVVSVAMQEKTPPAQVRAARIDGEITPSLKPTITVSIPELPIEETPLVEKQPTITPSVTIPPQIDSVVPEELPVEEPKRRQFSIGVRDINKTFE